MRYTMKKNKHNRYAYRGVGAFFILLSIAIIILTILHPFPLRMLVAFIAVGGICYGAYLIKNSFRKQAYDITYEFNEEGIKVIHKRGEEQIPFDQIIHVNEIQPDPEMLYKILQIKTTKEQFVLSFTGNVQDCDTIYAFLAARVKEKA